MRHKTATSILTLSIRHNKVTEVQWATNEQLRHSSSIPSVAKCSCGNNFPDFSVFVKFSCYDGSSAKKTTQIPFYVGNKHFPFYLVKFKVLSRFEAATYTSQFSFRGCIRRRLHSSNSESLPCRLLLPSPYLEYVEGCGARFQSLCRGA